MRVWVVTINCHYDADMVGGVYSNKALAGHAVMEMINYRYCALEMYYEYVTDMWDDGITFTIETVNQENQTTWYKIEPVTLNA